MSEDDEKDDEYEDECEDERGEEWEEYKESMKEWKDQYKEILRDWKDRIRDWKDQIEEKATSGSAFHFDFPPVPPAASSSIPETGNLRRSLNLAGSTGFIYRS